MISKKPRVRKEHVSGDLWINRYGPAWTPRLELERPKGNAKRQPFEPPEFDFDGAVASIFEMYRHEAEEVFRRERVAPTKERVEQILAAFRYGDYGRYEWRLYVAADLLAAVYRFNSVNPEADRTRAILFAIFAAERRSALTEFLNWEPNNPALAATAARKRKQQVRIADLRAALASGEVAETIAAVLERRGQAALSGKEREAARRQAQRDLKAARKPAK